jgi:hypothetical protein
MLIHPATVAGANGVALARAEELLKPLSKPFKRQGDPYALRSTMLSSQQSEVAVSAAVGAEGELYTQLT